MIDDENQHNDPQQHRCHRKYFEIGHKSRLYHFEVAVFGAGNPRCIVEG